MARPKVFVSSTYYDLKYIRGGLEAFIRQMGYEPILFEKGDIPFHHDTLLEESCLQEVDSADMLVLIIGGRYGSMSKEDKEMLDSDPVKFFGKIRSVTQKEYEKARDRDIPIFAFVEAQVLAEYNTYKANKDVKGVNYAFVDNVKIYELIEDIYSQRRNNFLKEFARLEDITSWLRDQWSGLFSDLLKQKVNIARFRNLEAQLSEMGQLVSALKTYNEEILRSVNENGSHEIILKQEKNIQRSKLVAFKKEPLIDHLIRAMNVRTPLLHMLRLFRNSDSVEGFLKKLKIRPREIAEFMEKYGEYAKRDFIEMKLRYGDDAMDALGDE